MLDKKVFFQRQVDECRELARHAVNSQDRAFWLHIAERWEGQLKQVKERPPAKKLVSEPPPLIQRTDPGGVRNIAHAVFGIAHQTGK